MEKWRKKIGLAVLASTALLAFAPNEANANRYSCDPCDTCCNDYNSCDFGGFEVGVDFLWWKPSADNVDTGIVRTSADHDSHNNLCPDWQPGVRVMFRMPKFYCDLGLCASYTFIEPTKKQHHHHNGGVFIPGSETSCNECDDQGGFAFDHAKAKWDLTYQEWDILFGYDIACSQCNHFKPFIGIAGINVSNDVRLHFHHEGDEDGGIHHRHNTDFWGVGLRAGAEYQYQLSDCLRFFALAHGTILAGESDHKSHNGGFDSKDNNCSHLVPGYHIGTGFSYNTSICNWDLAFRIGYEFLVWHNIRQHRDVNGGKVGDRTFGFQGLFVGLGVGF